MAHGFGRVPMAAEVDALQAEVGGDQKLVADRRTQDGAVVTDARDEGTVRR